MIDAVVTAMVLFSCLAIAFTLLFFWLERRAEARLRKTQQEYLEIRRWLQQVTEDENALFWNGLLKAATKTRADIDQAREDAKK